MPTQAAAVSMPVGFFDGEQTSEPAPLPPGMRLDDHDPVAPVGLSYESTVAPTMPYSFPPAATAPPIAWTPGGSQVSGLPADPRVSTGNAPWHIACLVLSLTVWCIIIAMAVLLGQRNAPPDPFYDPTDRSDSLSRSLFITYILLGIFVPMYYWEAACSSTLQYLNAQASVGGVEQYAQAMYAVVPRLVIWVNCYHWSYYHNYDYGGRGYTRSNTSSHRVYTHRIVVPVPLATYRDVSEPFPLLRGHALTKLHCAKSIAFADELSRVNFASLYAQVVAANRYRDTHYHCGYSVLLDGFQPEMLATADGTPLPCWLSLPAFIFATLLGFSWPYRMAVEARSVRAGYRFVKEVRLA